MCSEALQHCSELLTKPGSTLTPQETEIRTMVLDHRPGLEPLSKGFSSRQRRDWTSLGFWCEICGSQRVGSAIAITRLDLIAFENFALAITLLSLSGI